MAHTQFRPDPAANSPAAAGGGPVGRAGISPGARGGVGTAAGASKAAPNPGPAFKKMRLGGGKVQITLASAFSTTTPLDGRGT